MIDTIEKYNVVVADFNALVEDYYQQDRRQEAQDQQQIELQERIDELLVVVDRY